MGANGQTGVDRRRRKWRGRRNEVNDIEWIMEHVFRKIGKWEIKTGITELNKTNPGIIENINLE